MALIALAADKGAPGVTTTAVALGAIWPRSVLMAECDLAGGDLAYRLPSEQGHRLNPNTGLLSLAAQARHGLNPDQIWAHTQRLAGGLDVLLGVTSSEQASGLSYLWDQLGAAFAKVPDGDVLADCGRLGAHSAAVGLLRHAGLVVLLTRPSLENVVHTRERVTALSHELGEPGRTGPPIAIVVLSDPKDSKSSVDEVAKVVAASRLPATVAGGLAIDAKGAEMLRGQWGGRLDRSLLIRSAREVAGTLLNQVGPAGRTWS